MLATENLVQMKSHLTNQRKIVERRIKKKIILNLRAPESSEENSDSKTEKDTPMEETSEDEEKRKRKRSIGMYSQVF